MVWREIAIPKSLTSNSHFPLKNFICFNESPLKMQKNDFDFIFKLTSHGILHYLWSADLSKSFLGCLCRYLPSLNSFLNRFCLVEKYGVTLHCLYRDLLT